MRNTKRKSNPIRERDTRKMLVGKHIRNERFIAQEHANEIETYATEFNTTGRV